jgi:general L-amino acid transport system substrate-binding protein
VQQGTTTELNLADFFRANNLKYEVVAFASSDETIKAYDAGRCDVFTTDASGLYAERLKLAARPTTWSCRRSSPRSRSARSSATATTSLARHRQVDALRHGDRRGTRRHQGQCRRDAEVAQPEIKRLLGTEGKFGEASA